jgi:hypothetical protein
VVGATAVGFFIGLFVALFQAGFRHLKNDPEVSAKLAFLKSTLI